MSRFELLDAWLWGWLDLGRWRRRGVLLIDCRLWLVDLWLRQSNYRLSLLKRRIVGRNHPDGKGEVLRFGSERILPSGAGSVELQRPRSAALRMSPVSRARRSPR